MACYLSLSLFLFISLLFSSPLAHARDSKLFSKLTRHDAVADTSLADAPASAPEAPEAFSPAPTATSEYGYGLYSTQVNDTPDDDELAGDEGRYETRYDHNNNDGDEYDETKTRQGMSDTRFLENGKYFHDDKSDQNNYLYGHEFETQESTTQGTTDARVSGNDEIQRHYDNNYYNNNGNNDEGERYVFDSMEEYDKYQATHRYSP